MNKNTLKVFLAIVLLCSSGSIAQEDVSLLKTICIERFTRFIEWPEHKKSNMFTLVYLGDFEDPMKLQLEKNFKFLTVKNRKVNFVHCKHLSDLKKHETDVLFISKSTIEDFEKIIAYCEGKPILTISDTEHYAENGVLINFFIDQNKLKFEINEQAVRKSGLSVSFHLFKLAKIVQPSKK